MLRRATSPTRRNVVLGALVAVAATLVPATVVVADDDVPADTVGVAIGIVDGAVVAVATPPVPPAEEVAVGLPPVPPVEQVAVGQPPVPPVDQVAVGQPPVPPTEVVAVGKPPVPAQRSASRPAPAAAPVIASDLGDAAHAVFELIGL